MPQTITPQMRQPPVPARRPVARPAAPGYGLGFFLFLLVNAALFVRPADIIPDLLGWEIYQYVILACFAVSFPAALACLSPDRLEERPIDLCVLLLLPSVALSLLPHRNWGEMYESTFAFFKIIVYYLLLVSLVTTPRRLRVYLACLAAFATVTVLVSILDFHKLYIKIPRAPTIDANGRSTIDPNRMYGPGIFNDPNDLCVLIAVSLIIVFSRMADRRLGFGRWLWVVALGVFGYGFYLTQSRGGLLALFAGLGTVIWLRYGWRNAVLIGMLLFPGIVLFLGARQSAVSIDAETGQERIQLWSAGLDMVRNNPIFGVGWGHFARGHGATHVAHNSYMQAFGELGLFGGALFLGAYWLAVWGMFRLTLPVLGSRGQVVPVQIVDPDLKQLYPYLGGVVAAYAAGMFTLTLNGLVITYAMLGVVTLYLGMTKTSPERKPLKFELTLPVKFVGLAVAFLVGMFIFIRLTFRQ